ncbi:hypothetical protein GCM10027028_65390 [Streptomyces sundarbansensis]
MSRCARVLSSSSRPVRSSDAGNQQKKQAFIAAICRTLLVCLLDQAAGLSQAGRVHVRLMVINIPKLDKQRV